MFPDAFSLSKTLINIGRGKGAVGGKITPGAFSNAEKSILRKACNSQVDFQHMDDQGLRKNRLGRNSPWEQFWIILEVSFLMTG